MKKTVFSVAMMALLTGGFCTSARAMETTMPTTTEVMASENWDKLLDEYEKLVDQYIKVYKKVMKGDMTAAAESAKLAEKAQKLAAKLEKAKDQMTPAQAKRFAKIAMKMANALLED